MATELSKSLFSDYAPRSCGGAPPNKVSVIGCGQVGMACAVALLMQKVTTELTIVDVNKDLLDGELMDVQQGAGFLSNARITGGQDYALTAASRLCVVTAGARQKEGEDRLSLVQRNVAIMKSIVPELVKYSPDTIIMIVSNPCDLLTYVAWKLSGLPQHKVIGSGTNLDTARFRYMLSQKLGVSPLSIHAYIIGEHGDSSVAVWSAANVAGVRLRALSPDIGTPNDKDDFGAVHTEVIQAAYNIIKLKGYTNWAVGLSVSALANSFLTNSFNIHPVTVNCKGFYGIEDDIFLSMPCVLHRNGVQTIVSLKLEDDEISKLTDSAKTMKEIMNGLQLQ